jgi:hypothetical protein
LIAYEKSNHGTELPASFLGMMAYISYYDSPQEAVVISAMADLIDDIGGYIFLSPASASISTVSAINFAAAQTGNIYLAGATMFDNGLNK